MMSAGGSAGNSGARSGFPEETPEVSGGIAVMSVSNDVAGKAPGTGKPEGRGRRGGLPDVPDARDVHYVPSVDVANLPESVDLRPLCPPVYDQGNLGSCTANAIGAAIEYNQMQTGKQSFVPSRLFIYYNERVLEGTIKHDAGAMIRNGIGHCMLIVGYNNADRTFLVRNSWGTGWGQQGYGTMPYDYILSPKWTTDLWTIRSVTERAAKPLNSALPAAEIPAAPATPEPETGAGKRAF